MTNKEWLDYLAQNAPDELAAWFDAEHVETEERALDGDTEPQDADSREQLEADAFAYLQTAYITYPQIIKLLDRQAAITEEQTRCKWVTASADEIAAWRSKAEKLKEQVYELTAERERYREKFGKCIDYADAIHALMDDEGMA